LRDEEVTMPL